MAIISHKSLAVLAIACSLFFTNGFGMYSGYSAPIRDWNTIREIILQNGASLRAQFKTESAAITQRQDITHDAKVALISSLKEAYITEFNAFLRSMGSEANLCQEFKHSFASSISRIENSAIRALVPVAAIAPLVFELD